MFKVIELINKENILHINIDLYLNKIKDNI